MHAQSCPTLCDPMDCSHQAPLSMGFFRQEYWSGLPFPPPGDLPDPGIKPVSRVSPALAGGFLPAKSLGSPILRGGGMYLRWTGKASLIVCLNGDHREVILESHALTSGFLS